MLELVEKAGFQVVPQRCTDKEICCICISCDDSSGHLNVNRATGVMRCVRCDFSGHINQYVEEGVAVDSALRCELGVWSRPCQYQPPSGIEDYLGGLEYCPSSRFSNDLIRLYNVRVDGQSILFPIYSPGGELWGYQARYMGGRTDVPKYRFYPQGIPAKSTLYGYASPPISLDFREPVVVVEGVKDVLTVVSAGYQSAGLFGSLMTLDQMLLLSQFDCIILMPDNDESGSKMLKRFEELEHSSQVSTVAIPDPDGDPDSMGPGWVRSEVLQYEGR